MKYKVLKIEEVLDYGCEERGPEELVPALVTLEGEDGREKVLRLPDRLLYERQIEEGCWVYQDERSEWMRVEE